MLACYEDYFNALHLDSQQRGQVRLHTGSWTLSRSDEGSQLIVTVTVTITITNRTR
jgi:hypothetical protein